MKQYQFTAKATMKPYNSAKYWIDRNYVKQFVTSANTVKEACRKFAEYVNEQYYITISKRSTDRPQGMYVDTADGKPKQVGYVFTAKTMFDGKEQYFELWTDVVEIVSAF